LTLAKETEVVPERSGMTESWIRVNGTGFVVSMYSYFKNKFSKPHGMQKLKT
jgi:hypothetical protein